MYKYFLSLTALFSILNANIEKNSTINNLEMNSTLEEQTKQIIKDKNLNYLFENSKFPVDEYIYKAGFKKPKNKSISYDQEETKEEPIMELPIIENNITIDNDKIAEIEKKLKENEEKFKEKEVKPKNNYVTYQETRNKRLERLMRDSILSNRTSEIKDYQNNTKFGVDGFSNQESIDIATNEHKLSRMIRAGRMIPALLMTSISSDVSGLVSAQIEQDIYAAHGRAVLIPRGSKAIGFYANTSNIGQNRIEIQWREIITPQGVNILLTNAFTADNMGMNGAIGAVNNKYWDRYALPLGISTISNALLITIAGKMNKTGNGNSNNINVNDYQQQIFQGAQADINEVVKDILQQHKSIQPTIEIKSGSRIFLVPNHHMWFSKPKNGEVLMRYFED